MNPRDYRGGIIGLLADLIVTAPRPQVTLTEAQRALLAVIRKHGHEGWGEVCRCFASGRNLPQYLESSVLARVASVLERQGLSTIDDEYPSLTPAGEAVLAGGAP